MTFEQLFISYALNGIAFDSIVGKVGGSSVADIRNASIYLLKDNYTIKELSLFFRKNKPSINYSIKKVNDLIDVKDRKILDTIKLLQSKVQ